MIGNVVLTLDRPLVRYSDGMCVSLEDGRVVLRPACEGTPAYVMFRPYKGAYPYTRVLDPIMVPGPMAGSTGWASMYVVYEYQQFKGIRKHTFLRLGNVVRRQAVDGDVGLFSGATKKGMYGLVVRMFRSSVERYVRRSVGMHIAELRLSADLEDIMSLVSTRGLQTSREGGLTKAYGNGMMVLARGRSHGTLSVSVAVGIGMQKEFTRLVVDIFRAARTVHSVRLGELGEAAPPLDLFLPVGYLGERD